VSNASIKKFGSIALPIGVFCLAYGLHYFWFSTHPEPKTVEQCCAGSCELPAAWDRYIQSHEYLIGYMCALGFAFSADALRRFIELRSIAARNTAAGSFGLTALFSGAACFLLGCCGSPMLGVWLTLFGANVLPMAKPIAAGVATIAVALSAWWTYRKQAQSCCAPGASCQST